MLVDAIISQNADDLDCFSFRYNINSCAAIGCTRPSVNQADFTLSNGFLSHFIYSACSTLSVASLLGFAEK